ncbi:unnamed protein product [Protopolystoma xenopodis]|uniref:FHA domain-containing protein n=1 Tax=Protopolystoma xenopodis TaxID=117903 RepID=A0A3S5A8Z1_9PLAT|nr:unnamed protein product [Protopolystoma xenopodis]
MNSDVFFGRASQVYHPDIDLSQEGEASRISRCHGYIRQMLDGSFRLANFADRPVFIDGSPILKESDRGLDTLQNVSPALSVSLAT